MSPKPFKHDGLLSPDQPEWCLGETGFNGKLRFQPHFQSCPLHPPPLHGACAWSTQLRRRPQPRPDLCGCPPTPGPPGDARGRAGAHGQVSQYRERRPRREREGPRGPRAGPTLGTRSPQLPGGPRAARQGTGLPGMGRGRTRPHSTSNKSRSPWGRESARLSQREGHPEGVRPRPQLARQAGRTRPESRREPRRQAPAAGRSAPAPRPSPPPGLRPRLRAPGLSRRLGRREGTGSALSGREAGGGGGSGEARAPQRRI